MVGFLSVGFVYLFCLLQNVLTGILLFLHHCATLNPLLLHFSTWFAQRARFCSFLNVLIPLFIRNFPIVFIVVDCRRSSTTYLLGYFRMFSNPLQDAGLFDGYKYIKLKLNVISNIELIFNIYNYSSFNTTKLIHTFIKYVTIFIPITITKNSHFATTT